MILEGNEKFSWHAKAQADRDHPKVQEWKQLMWRFEKALPQGEAREKWLGMERIFKLEG